MDRDTSKADLFADTIDAGIAFMQEADRALRLAVQGITTLQGTGELVEAVRNFQKGHEKAWSPTSDKKIQEAHTLSRMAREEIAEGFPILLAHTCVAMWSALEATITNSVAAWLIFRPSALANREFAKIRVPIAIYEGLSSEARMRFIVNQLEQSLAAPLKPGIGRFEAILTAIGLGGSVDDRIKRTLFELSQVRNLIVHRFSIVDEKFATNCKWLDVKPGQKFKIEHEQYDSYRVAVIEYLTEIVKRATEARWGGGVPEMVKGLLSQRTQALWPNMLSRLEKIAANRLTF